MPLVVENLRLRELMVIVRSSRPFFDHFVTFLRTRGYASLHEFVTDADAQRAYSIILSYLRAPIPEGVLLFDGIARPYPHPKAKKLLLGWIFRDAPEQRLRPLLRSAEGSSDAERTAYLINELRKHVALVLPEPERWEWIPISEVLLDRLEGSRRAIKGNLIEGIVRRALEDVLARHGLALQVERTQRRIGTETYDVIVCGGRGELLIPVKSRETMGGGHAHLFTRDIRESIRAATAAGYQCLPVVIAESWSGDLSALSSEDFVFIETNPNQIVEIEGLVRAAFEDRTDLFRSIL